MVCRTLPPSAVNMTLIIQTMRDDERLTRQSVKKIQFPRTYCAILLHFKKLTSVQGFKAWQFNDKFDGVWW